MVIVVPGDAFLLLLCYSGKMLWFVVCDGLVGSLGAQVCIVHSTCQISSELTFQIQCEERFKWVVEDPLPRCSSRTLKFELLGITQSFCSAKKCFRVMFIGKVVHVMGIREVFIIVQNIFDLPVTSNLCDLKFHNCSLSILKKKKCVHMDLSRKVDVKIDPQK